MKKVVFTILNLILCLCLLGSPVKAAVNIQPRTAFNVEVSAEKFPERFGNPKFIYVTPISLETDEFIDSADWYRGLYYYQAYRLNQGDVLFHYFVTSKGEIIEGNQNKEEQRFNIPDNKDNPIIIGYMAGKDDLDFSQEARTNLQELILEIANKYAIPLENIVAKSIEFVAKEREAVTTRVGNIGGRWDRSIKEMTKSIADRYKPEKKVYTFKVEKIELPKNAVNYGDNIVVNLQIKNTSSHFFYSGSEADPIISKVGEGFSKFYLNSVWLSPYQASFMPENVMIKPGDIATYQIRLGTPLYFGEIAETFQLANSLGKPHKGTEFAIKLNINKPKKEVIEITPTETGQLNVRANASGYAEVVGKVTPGQRFFVLERNSSGWVKLDLGDNKSGWVVSKYTKTV